MSAVRLVPARSFDPDALARAGWAWLASESAHGAYHAAHLVAVAEGEAEALAQAADALYAMVVDTVGDAIDGGRLDDLGVPPRLHRLAEYTWHDDRHWHVWGRFDLAGGLGGAAPRLIEFNADTATSLPELAVLQWAQALGAGYSEAHQLNTLFEQLVEQFGRLRALNGDLGTDLLCTGFPDAPEDDANLAVLGAAAEAAGYTVRHRSIDAVTLSPGEGVFTDEPDAPGGWVRHDTVVKLVPWEQLALDEPEAFDALERVVLDRDAVVVNPAYAAAMQSKRLLAALWDRYPDHPLLLPASREPLAGPHVEKRAFGREGASITVRDAMGRVTSQTPGDYGGFLPVYQAWADLPRDLQGRRYQAGVAWAFQGCALGFRRGGAILTDESPFLGHVVSES